MKVDIDSDPVVYAKLRDYIVTIDCGHAQSTPGKKIYDFQEWEFNRVVGKKLAAKLSRAGVDVRMCCPQSIKEDEIDIPLKDRANRVNDIVDLNPHKKVIGVSIHSNAFGNGSNFSTPSGFSVFIAKQSSNASKKLAKIIYKHALKHNWKGNRVLPPEGYWTAGFAMCRLTKCPFILTENLFYTNKEEYEFLMTEEGREEIAQMHFDAIMDYILG